MSATRTARWRATDHERPTWAATRLPPPAGPAILGGMTEGADYDEPGPEGRAPSPTGPALLLRAVLALVVPAAWMGAVLWAFARAAAK